MRSADMFNISCRNETSTEVDSVNFVAYAVVCPMLVVVGLVGNYLNWITLRSVKLQTVPFLYVRAIGTLDLIALAFTLQSGLDYAKLLPQWPWLIYYSAYCEKIVVNSFFTASVLIAVALTVERWRLVCRPHLAVAELNPKRRVTLMIALACAAALLIHFPMCLEYSVMFDSCANRLKRHRNPKIFNEPDAEKLFTAYKIVREVLLRVLAVTVLATVNIVIAKELKVTRAKRDAMILRKPKRKESSNSGCGRKLSALKLLCSFEESRLTTILLSITAIYVIGNVPQALLIILNKVGLEANVHFQVFRAFANLMEVNNHCVCFYVFCLTSQDYYDSFKEIGSGCSRRSDSANNPTSFTELNGTGMNSKRSALNLSTELLRQEQNTLCLPT